jgi:hypothetical protein
VVIPTFVLWKWHSPTFRTTYSSENANQLVRQMCKHHVPREKIILVTDDPEGVTECRTFQLWPDMGAVKNISGPHLPSCYRRLKILDFPTLKEMGIAHGERVVSMDLDAVILQNFLDLFQGEGGDFWGWQVPGTIHPKVLNGSLWMFTAGKLQYLWDQFDPHKSPGMAANAGYMGSDQGYLSYNLINREFVKYWTNTDGVLCYTRDIRKFRYLPRHTKVVFFPGKMKPWDQATLRESPWIKRYIVEPEKESVPCL